MVTSLAVLEETVRAAERAILRTSARTLPVVEFRDRAMRGQICLPFDGRRFDYPARSGVFG